MRHQLGFYKYLKNITFNTRIKYFQTIQTYILEPVMLSHNIIVHIQLQDKSQ